MSEADVIGSLGVSVLLGAFFLNVTGFVSAEHRGYAAANFVGAALSCYASWAISFMPFVVLEGTWAIVAAVALFRRRDRGAVPPAAEVR